MLLDIVLCNYSMVSHMCSLNNKLYNRKKQLKVYISEDLWKKLVRYAPVIYGRTYGCISYVVEEALRQYLSRLEHTAKTHKQNFKVDPYSVWDSVREEIKRILNTTTTPHVIPERILRRAIIQVRGSDPRTIEKWINVFINMKVIKHIDGFKPNRVFEII